MKPSQALTLHRLSIRQIVARHHAANARVFGSVAQGCDTEESDLDLLVDPTPETTLFDIGAIRYELSALPYHRSHRTDRVLHRVDRSTQIDFGHHFRSIGSGSASGTCAMAAMNLSRLLRAARCSR